MANMSIGLSGLIVAQQAIDVIGTNIANAGTDGYHSQTPVIKSISMQSRHGPSTGGAKVTGVSRAVNQLLEAELLRHQPLLGQTQQELMTLQSIESSLGQLGSQGLTDALTKFFNDLGELATQPQSPAYQQQVVWSADALAGQFSNLGNFLVETANSLRSETQDLVSQVNNLTGRIAELNCQILAVSGRGDSSNLLMDQRDNAIRQLAEIIPVETNTLANNEVRNVSASGVGLVIGARATEMELGVNADRQLGITLKDAFLIDTNLTDGRLGAALTLQNDVIVRMTQQLDAMANAVMSNINRMHVQGVGSAGAFEELVGSVMGSKTINNWPQQVDAGSFNVRVTDTATGEVNRYAISVDPVEDTVADVAARLAATPGINAVATDGRLRIQADVGYTFDFRPGVEAVPTSSSLTGTSAPSISGNYGGDENEVYGFTVEGSGQVGIATDLKLAVRNGSGELIKTLNVGQGYPPGTRLAVSDGVYVTLPTGTLIDGEQFTAEALAQSDPTGFLAAAGMNTLFAGNSALTMRVNADLLDNTSSLAVSTSKAGGDNLNVLAMSEMGQQKMPSLGDVSPAEYLQFFVTSLGQKVSLAKSRQEGASQVLRQLETQWEEVSGVDINEQAAKLMVFERLFQACAKFLNTQDQSLDYLMEML